MASESNIQSRIRLEGARKGYKLWRNNSGVLSDANGRPVRFGLANDSKRLNETIKSSDLIGWRPVLILPEHVGITIAQFVSIECKEPGWKFSERDARAVAQRRWIDAVRADGGMGFFAAEEGLLL